jgi:transposase
MNTHHNSTEEHNLKTGAPTFVGVDISKQELVCDLPFDTRRVYKRTALDIEELIAKLPPNAHIICEATGGYEKMLVRALHKARIKVSVMMPWRVRAYAISQCIIAKNDAIDARVLSQYGRNTERLRETKPLRAVVETMRELMRARDELIEQIKHEKNQAEHAGQLKMLLDQAAKRMETFRKQKKEVEQAIRAHIRQDPQMKQRSEKCRQVKGVGEVTVWTALCELPELGELDKGQAGHLLGVAPICNQSGKHEAPRHIKGGRPKPRRVIYMAAVSASQHNPILKVFYERLIAKGKARKVALVAVMRKLIELINRIFADPNFSLAG